MKNTSEAHIMATVPITEVKCAVNSALEAPDMTGY